MRGHASDVAENRERLLTFDELIARHVLQELSEGLAQRQKLAEISRSEIRSGGSGVRSFSTDLNHADHFVGGENGRADDFLNGLAERAGNLFTLSKTLA